MTGRMLITGAAGFIGRVAWDYFDAAGWELFGVDDLSRPSAQRPEDLLRKGHEFYQRDVCDIDEIELPAVDVVLHLAAQVSVTRSISCPARDFKTNAMGTFRVAQWAQRTGVECFIYSSTNKVFGSLPGQRNPIRDDQPLQPKTPYGVSKATGGMYVRELLPDVGYDLRQSCIYGDTQFGTEDQGWVGFLNRRIAMGEPVVCYGDGTQVRDLLHVADLVKLYDLIITGKAMLPAGSYTVGGGEANTISFQDAVRELGGEIRRYEPWRQDDQKYFVSANEHVTYGSCCGWRPDIVARTWLRDQSHHRMPKAACDASQGDDHLLVCD